MVKHIVLIKPKRGKSEAEATALLAEIGGLKSRIPGILDYSGGADISGGGRTEGYTHGFVMTFASKEALGAYLPHPEHTAVAAKVIAFSEDILAFDYEY